MKAFLSGTALAAAVLFAPQFGRAQTAPAPQAGAAQGQLAPVPQEAVQRMQQAGATLRQAVQAYGSSQEQPQTQAVRQALGGLQQAMGQMPAAHRAAPGHRALEREVTEAQQVFQGERVDPARARAELDQVLAAMQPALAEMGVAGGAVPGAAAVVVRESAPTVQVQQAAPLVTVQQPEPVVTVVVPQPEIIVRQPPPQVTVQIPPPQVQVQQVQPQVRVVEAQPQVQVTPAQPQVQVQQVQPRVQVQQAPGQPTVRYEQQGEAQVKVDQQGQQTAAAGAAAGVAAGAAAGSGAQPAAAGVPLQRATTLIGTNLVGANGRDAGSVENLLIDAAGNVRGAVVEWGGFLGIGQRRAVVPIEQIQFGEPNERARLGMTREQLEQLGTYDQNNLAQYGTRHGWGEGVRLFR